MSQAIEAFKAIGNAIEAPFKFIGDLITDPANAGHHLHEMASNLTLGLVPPPDNGSTGGPHGTDVMKAPGSGRITENDMKTLRSMFGDDLPPGLEVGAEVTNGELKKPQQGALLDIKEGADPAAPQACYVPPSIYSPLNPLKK